MKTHSIALLLALLPAVAPAQGQTHAEIEQRAMTSHPKVRAAEAALKSAQAERGLLAAPFKPMLTANGYFAAGDGSPIFSSTVAPVNWAKLGPDGVAVGNFMFMWSVWSGGRDSTARSLGSSRVEAAEHMLEAVRQDVLLGVRTAYAEHAYRYEVQQAAKADSIAAQETERIARQREEAGKAPRAFVLRADAAARASERDVALAEAGVAGAFAKLEEAVGGPVEITLVTKLTVPDAPTGLE
ncbi:MAG: TolC family protein, partial [Armatimonadetes bacterium]|nr:TolC family protein [Armatimonadota bacterium]